MVRSTASTVRVSRPRRTAPILNIDKEFLLFVTNWRTATTAGNARDKAKAQIKRWFESGGDGDHEVMVNENGSQIIEFAEPVAVDGVKVTGLENRRTAVTELDLDKVDAWLEGLDEETRKAYAKKLYKPVTDYVFQPDALFALQQQGKITEDQLDSLMTTSESWALCVTKDWEVACRSTGTPPTPSLTASRARPASAGPPPTGRGPGRSARSPA